VGGNDSDDDMEDDLVWIYQGLTSYETMMIQMNDLCKSNVSANRRTMYFESEGDNWLE
jgi:hypothetical protein